MSARSLTIAASATLVTISLGLSCLGRPNGVNPEFDSLRALATRFPQTISVKNHGRLIEFCPDNTCDGFVASKRVPIGELKDFAYLYEYFFSQYIYLPEWRSTASAKLAAEKILSRPAYQKCKGKDSHAKARCVLLALSYNRRIKLIFIRYDEGRRNVVPEDIRKEVSR